MKRSELFFGAVRLPLDFGAVLTAAIVAYALRVSPTVQRIRPAVFEIDLPFLEYMQLAVLVALVTVAVFALHGLYAMQSTRRYLDEATRIFSGVSIGIMLVIIAMFLRAEQFQSRFILLAAYVFALILVMIGRLLVRWLQVTLLKRGFGVHRVALAGNGRYALQLAEIFRRLPRLGYSVVGIPAVVNWEVMESLYQNEGLDEVIQTDPLMSEEDNLVLLEFCDKYKIDYKYIPNMFEAHAANVHFRQLGGIPVMELQRTPLDGWGRVAKRATDIVGALVGMVLFSPVLLTTAVAIRINSRGPILYSQVRMGRNKRPFNIYKFRSMYMEYCTGAKYGGGVADKFEEGLRKKTNERQGPLFKMRNDPRITPVGRFIRKWRIDELPQFINVLRGEMSLLGPRPHLSHEVELYDKHHQKLFTIKPGMSGMAQVNGNAGLTFEQEANLDIAYIENWSFKTDIVLLIKTFWLLVTDKNAV